jgi:hypothetical protein
MPRFARSSVLAPVIAALVFSGVLSAQTAPPAAAASDRDPSLSPSPGSAHLKRDRPISDGVASSLAASMPKYNPPPKSKPEDDVDSREVDKPKNGIIRLPKYTVQERKPPVFRERDIYTAGGLADLARKRYITRLDLAMNRFYIPFLSSSPEERALAMYAEDERLNNMSDLKDVARTVGQTDAAGSRYIKRVSDDTYLRSGGSGYESGPGARH